MDCPRCALPLVETEYETVSVDVCEQCWGFWLDPGELEEVLLVGSLVFSEEEREAVLGARTAWDAGPEEPAACPVCAATMERASYDESVHLVIDRCSRHGVWLDTGEIKKLQAVAETSADIHRMLLRKLGL
ncbi:MAG: zf-TFIIB domain-containing protein [Planctomycetota bacterium]|jgi:Zn-finger nucleic acid-binding protein